MKLLFILSLIVLSAFASNLRLEGQLIKDLFQQWKLTHDKVYSTDREEESRFKIFSENYIKILEFNAEQSDVVLGLNHLADLTLAEFSALYTGLIPKGNANAEVAHFDATNLADGVDWRTKGAVTPIKNQGQCGSCWAFSAVGALEGSYQINTGKLESFSEQQLVDCVTADQGCGGGWMIDAFDYTAKAGGIETEADYPYKATNQKCAFDQSKAVKVNSGFKNVTENSADQLKAAANVQPVSVAIQASALIFQFYRTGVIKRWCGAKLDHGVLVVGYDSSQGSEAFIVKNSWGVVWGKKGYVHISTDGTPNNGAGVCGILAAASIPTW
jgi:KDEL-tailed cysteine endopeptidase